MIVLVPMQTGSKSRAPNASENSSGGLGAKYTSSSACSLVWGAVIDSPRKLGGRGPLLGVIQSFCGPAIRR